MDFEELKQVRNVGFNREMGFDVVCLKEGYAKVQLKITPKHYNPIGTIHGGLLFALADNVGGYAATSRGRFVTTLSGNMNFLRAVPQDCPMIYGESVEIKIGKKICVYQVIIRDCNEREIAIATMTYSYLDDGKVKLTVENETKE